MSLMMRRRMLLASKEEDTNLIKLSADTILGAGSSCEILSKNSIKIFNPLNPSVVNSRYRTVNFKITPNSKIRITFDYKRNYEINNNRFIVWKITNFPSSSGTFIIDARGTDNGGSIIINLSESKTTNVEYLGLSFYLNDSSTIDANAELLITNLKAEYVEG